MSIQRDYILRMVEMVRLALARALRRRDEGDLVGARQEIETACEALLGPLEEVAPMVDSATAAQLLGDARRVLAWARLVAEDAELRRLLGDEIRTAVLERRALELALEACREDPGVGADAGDLVAELRGRVGAETLADRYRETLGWVLEPPRG